MICFIHKTVKEAVREAVAKPVRRLLRETSKDDNNYNKLFLTPFVVW